MRLNRRLAPDVYLGVVRVRLGPEGYGFGADGDIVDFVETVSGAGHAAGAASSPGKPARRRPDAGEPLRGSCARGVRVRHRNLDAGEHLRVDTTGSPEAAVRAVLGALLASDFPAAVHDPRAVLLFLAVGARMSAKPAGLDRRRRARCGRQLAPRLLGREDYTCITTTEGAQALTLLASVSGPTSSSPTSRCPRSRGCRFWPGPSRWTPTSS